MSIRLIELLALDANGTIFNDTPQFIRAANGIFAHFGKPELDSQILRDRWTQPWTKIYREAGILEADVTDDDLYTLYNKLYKEALSMRQPKPFSGLRMVLAQLKRWGVKLVVVSGQQNKVTIPLLERYDILKYFSNGDIRVHGEISDKTAKLIEICEADGLMPNKCMYMGDQLGDVVAANSAGWVSVASTKGLHTRDKLAEGQPDHWIKKPSNILGLPILKKETTDDK